MQTSTKARSSNDSVVADKLYSSVLRMHWVTAILPLIVIGGCSGCDKEWQTVKVTDKQATTCGLVVYSPPYGKGARSPDDITVVWDGKQVFAGVLPSRRSGPQGMPIELLEIRTSPGKHVLEVRHGTQSQMLSVELKDQQTVHVRVFGVSPDGRETLIQNLGDNPKFN